MGQGKSVLTGSRLTAAKSGFILLEVLIAMLIMEVGILALMDLLMTSVKIAHQVEQRLEMLQVLRGEFEQIEQTPVNELSSTDLKTYDNFTLFTRIIKWDQNKDLITDYRIIYVRLYPKDQSGMRDYYECITYRLV